MKRYFVKYSELVKTAGIAGLNAAAVAKIATNPWSYTFLAGPAVLNYGPSIMAKTGLSRKFYESSLNHNMPLRRLARNLDFIWSTSVKESPKMAKATRALATTPVTTFGTSDVLGVSLLGRGILRRALPDKAQQKLFKNRTVVLPAIEDTVEKHFDNIKDSIYSIKKKSPGEAFLYGLKNDGKRIILKNKS